VKFSKSQQIIDLTPAGIAPLISQHHCDRLVLTGGEPLLQQEELVELLQLLPEIPIVEVETNGTQIPSDVLREKITQFNVSPKLSNSGMDEKLRLNFDALHVLTSLPNAILKFVVCDQTDLDEARELQDHLQFPSSRTHLMPEGRDAATLQARSLWLADICRDHGFRFSPRLHVLLWGNERAK